LPVISATAAADAGHAVRSGLRLVEHGEQQPADHGHVLMELDPRRVVVIAPRYRSG
jgi:hypothetical protein